MKLSNFKITNKGLYWGLIATFALLYLFVGFVSTLHSITFFNLANSMGLAILLGVTYEIGQASVLFSILMSEKNKGKFLPWALMILLTALQVTANVYASFKFMATSGSTDWQYWQKSILIGVQAANPEMYQIIISWIAGALLPIVALGMTALVAQNMNFITEENEEASNKRVGSIPDEEVDQVIKDEVDKRVASLLDTAKIANLDKPSELVPSIDNAFNVDEGMDKMSDYLDEEIALISDVANETPENQVLDESKKAQEPLLNEDVKVPQNENLGQNEIDITPPRTEPVKSLEEAFKPSPGDEVIKLIENLEKAKVKESINQQIMSDDVKQETYPVESGNLTPYLEGGVEVIDAKAVQKS